MKISFSSLFSYLFSFLLSYRCLFSFFVQASAVGTAYAYSPNAITTASVQAESGPSMSLDSYECALMDLTGQYVFAAGSSYSNAGPYAFISNDYGQNYTQLTNTPNDNYAFCAGTSNLTIIYLLGSSNPLYKVIGGNVNATWTVLSPPPSVNYLGVATDTNTGTFVTLISYQQSKIVYSTDGGKKWNTSTTIDLFFSIAASATGNLFHVITNSGNQGNYYSLDHGETWIPGDLPAGAAWNSVSCNAAGTLVVSVGIYVYLSENSGQHWTQIEGAAAYSWLAVAVSPNANSNSQYTIIVSNLDGTSIFSNDSGQSFNPAQSLNEVGNSFGFSSDGYYSVMAGDTFMWYGQSYSENWCISEAGVTCNLVYTQFPTTIPTALPTAFPTYIPSVAPTASPSAVPTIIPTYNPSSQPSSRPTISPSSQPISNPTGRPSVAPSSQPSNQPTSHPTQNNDDSAVLTDGQIAGIIIGSVVGFLALLTVIIYYFLINKSSKTVVEYHDPSKSRSNEAAVIDL